MGGGGVNSTASPDVTILNLVVPNPTVTAGAVAVATPSVIQTVVPTPTTTSGGVGTPSSVVIQTVIVSPTVTAGVKTTPAAVIFQVVVPTPTIQITAQQYRPFTTVLGERDEFAVVLGSRDEWDAVLGDAVSVPTKNLEMYLGEDRSLPYIISEDLSSIDLACTLEDATGAVVASFTSQAGEIVKETNGSTSTGYVQIDSASTVDLSPGVVTWSIFSNTVNDHVEYCNGQMSLLAPRAVL